MAVVGTGDFRYEAVEGWEQLPAGWQHKDVAGVATDSQDRVYLITRADPRVIVYNKDGSFASSWGEDEFTPRTHGISEDEVVEKIMLTEPAIKRLIEPEEVAEFAAFLCTPEASFINGASLVMDGAATAH